MQASEYNIFSSINGDGVTVADTFNTWRKSTNGIIQKLTVEAGSPTWDTSGKVVIGAAVTNGNAATVDIGVARTGSGDATINLGSVAGSNNVVIGRASGANGAFSITNNGTGLFSISQAGAGAISLLTAGAEKVRILVDGKVGIGIAAPTELLHVNGGNFKVTGNILGSGSIAGTNITASGFLNASTLGVGTSNTAFTVAADGVVSAKRLLVGDGTTGAPSITFSADGATDTGFNHTTDGVIQVVCNAQSVGTFTSAGFVGNSTTSTNSQGAVFRTAVDANEGSIGVKLTGKNDAYLYSNTSSWGLYSADGGTLCYHLRSDGRNRFIGAAASLMNSGAGNSMQFNYSSQGGQPTWLWGSNDAAGENSFVWNPANFNVNSANSATYASYAYNSVPNGTLYCSNTAQVTKLVVGGFNQNAAGIVCVANGASNNNVSPAIQFYAYAGEYRGGININSEGTKYTSNSDYRLKTDYAPIQNAVDRVNTLNPLNFKWIESGSRNDGFLAHEVAEVVPNAVSGIKDAVDDDGKPIIQSIDMSKLIPLLTAAIQELSARVATLESAQL